MARSGQSNIREYPTARPSVTLPCGVRGLRTKREKSPFIVRSAYSASLPDTAHAALITLPQFCCLPRAALLRIDLLAPDSSMSPLRDALLVLHSCFPHKFDPSWPSHVTTPRSFSSAPCRGMGQRRGWFFQREVFLPLWCLRFTS